MLKPVILVVDDEPANLALVRAILDHDYRLVYARDGTETLAAVHKHQPAMVLLDIGLPDTDGYELCRRIKQADETAAIQIIFVTMYSSAQQETAGFEAGAVDYIVKPVSAPILRARVAAHLSLVRATVLERSYRDAILMLGRAGHYNDTDTGAHIWRMAAYAGAIARACGWDDDSRARLELAAPMHDTGKIGIPHAILRKAGPLDEDEWKIMRTHPQIGYDILSKGSSQVFKVAAEVSLHHHEKWDGTGYPQGLRGDAIPASARIVAVADVFDALRMSRPYKPAWPLDRVRAHLVDNAGSHFDPEVVRCALEIMPALVRIGEAWDGPATPAEDRSQGAG
jgi:putative two-component system response regulator